MDFTWTDEDAAYRARIRAFLDRELPDNWDEIARHAVRRRATSPRPG